MNDESSPPNRKSRLAITSLVLGISGIVSPATAWLLFFAFGTVCGVIGLVVSMIGTPLAFVFGIVALNQINKSGGRITGRGQAIAGLIAGAASLLLYAAMILPAIHGAREKARLMQCWNNLKQISLAVGLYANEHDGNIPRQFDDLRPYATNLDKLLICPSARDTSHPSYQIMLGGGKWERHGDNPDAIVVMESASDHRFGYHVLLNDGHVEFRSNGQDPSFKPN